MMMMMMDQVELRTADQAAVASFPQPARPRGQDDGDNDEDDSHTTATLPPHESLVADGDTQDSASATRTTSFFQPERSNGQLQQPPPSLSMVPPPLPPSIPDLQDKQNTLPSQPYTSHASPLLDLPSSPADRARATFSPRRPLHLGGGTSGTKSSWSRRPSELPNIAVQAASRGDRSLSSAISSHRSVQPYSLDYFVTVVPPEE